MSLNWELLIYKSRATIYLFNSTLSSHSQFHIVHRIHELPFIHMHAPSKFSSPSFQGRQNIYYIKSTIILSKYRGISNLNTRNKVIYRGFLSFSRVPRSFWTPHHQITKIINYTLRRMNKPLSTTTIIRGKTW